MATLPKLGDILRELDLADAAEPGVGAEEHIPSLQEVLQDIDIAQWRDKAEFDDGTSSAAVPGMKELLKGIDEDEVAELSSDLLSAVQQRDCFQVQALLRDGADPHARLPSGESLLEEAVRGDAADVAGLLLGHGADFREPLASAGVEAREDADSAGLLLCKIFRDKSAESEERKTVLRHLDPGVLGKVRWRLCFPGPFATGGASPEQSYKAGATEQLRPTRRHRVLLHLSDPMRPLLVLEPSDRQPTAVLLLLHGFFQSGPMLEHLARELSEALPHVLLLAPTAPTRHSHVGVGPSWYWLADQWDAGEGVDPLDEIESCRLELLRLLGAVGLPPERLAVLGFSQGGALAAWLALRLPSVAAALGLFSTEVSSLGRFVGRAGGREVLQGAEGLSVLQCHGACDKVVGIQRAEGSVQELKSLGCHARLSSHRGVGHVLCPAMIAEAGEWLRGLLRRG